LVVAVAEGAATVTASLLGEPLTSAITVSCAVGCGGGGGTFADRVFVVELGSVQQGFSIPFDRSTNSLGSVSAPITLSGFPSGTACDPTDDILLIRTGTGFDAFRNEVANLVALGGTAVPDANFIGFHRSGPALDAFTAVDAFGGSQIHSISVDRVTGSVTMGAAVPSLGAGSGFDHGFIPSGASDALFIHLGGGGNVWGKGTIDPGGSLTGVTTFPLVTGMATNARIVVPPDESFITVVGNGLAIFDPDASGDLVPRGPPVATAATALQGFVFDGTGSCGVSWSGTGDQIGPFVFAGTAQPMSQGTQTVPGYIFLDDLIRHPDDDVLFAVGRSTGDEPVIEVLEVDGATCAVTPSGTKIVLPVGPGFVTGSVAH
jgi:hypothetical protein